MRSISTGNCSGPASEDVELNVDLILDLVGAARDTHWLDAEVRLLDGDVASVRVSASTHDYADGFGHAGQCQHSVHFPLSVGYFLDAGGLEGDLGILGGLEREFLHVLLNLEAGFLVNLGVGLDGHVSRGYLELHARIAEFSGG